MNESIITIMAEKLKDQIMKELTGVAKNNLDGDYELRIEFICKNALKQACNTVVKEMNKTAEKIITNWGNRS